MDTLRLWLFMILKGKIQLIAGAILLSSTTFTCNVQLSTEDLCALYQQSRAQITTLQQEKASLLDRLNAAEQAAIDEGKKAKELLVHHTAAESDFQKQITEAQRVIRSLTQQVDELKSSISIKANEFNIVSQRYNEIIAQNNNIVMLLGTKEKDLQLLNSKVQAQKAHAFKVKDLVTSIRDSYNHDMLNGTVRPPAAYRYDFERIYEMFA